MNEMNETGHFPLFISAAVKVFSEMFDIKISRGEPVKEGDEFSSLGCTGLVGLTGKIRGRVIVDMSPKVAVSMTERLTGLNYETSASDDVMMTLAEVVNIISGNAITEINNQYPEFNIRLSPPSVFIGEELTMFNLRLNSWSVILHTPFGPLKLNVALEERR